MSHLAWIRYNSLSSYKDGWGLDRHAQQIGYAQWTMLELLDILSCMKAKLDRDWLFYPTFFLAILIGFGFYGILDLKETINNKRTIWELIMFAFIAGSLILTMSSKVLRKEQKEYFPRIGSSIILAGIILLVGSGISTILYSPQFYYLGVSVTLFGIFFLSFSIASLFIEFGKTIIDLR